MEREEDNKEEITLSSSLTSSIPKRSVMSQVFPLPVRPPPPGGNGMKLSEAYIIKEVGIAMSQVSPLL
jgi:hypothetical protein